MSLEATFVLYIAWARYISISHDTPDLSSERTPDDNKDRKHQGRLKSDHESRNGLDTKTDRLTDRQC